MIFVLSVTDWGELQNLAYGKPYYKPREIVQAHLLILGSHVWVERNKTLGLYRVAFGVNPVFAELVTFDQAKSIIEKYFLGLVTVTI